MLNAKRALEQTRILLEVRATELPKLNTVRRYWKGIQRRPAVIPLAAPREVKVMDRASRINVLELVIDSMVQSTYVDGFRADGEKIDVWDTWQANKMDARQTAIHRAAAAYGTAYQVVLPGSPAPRMRGVSPRAMTTLYGEDPDWPMWALERRGKKLWVLYDEDAAYFVAGEPKADGDLEFIDARVHDAGVGAPVVRYLDKHDLDDDIEVDDDMVPVADAREVVTRGQIAGLMPLQDQLDLATFNLQVVQHYGAFRQRYILGWTAEDETKAIKAGASTFLTLDVDPEEVKVGEFEQNDLGGYIKSREATLRHVAMLGQLPPHEILGEMVNLSAEALAAAEASKERKAEERQTVWGESHEQALWLAGKYQGEVVPNDAEVVWRDTSARAFAATVDGLGKLAQMLGVPPQELWEKIPGATQQDVERWKAAAQEGDAFSNLTSLLEQQAVEPSSVG